MYGSDVLVGRGEGFPTVHVHLAWKEPMVQRATKSRWNPVRHARERGGAVERGLGEKVGA
jgi:hypothetical protein